MDFSWLFRFRFSGLAIDDDAPVRGMNESASWEKAILPVRDGKGRSEGLAPTLD